MTSPDFFPPFHCLQGKKTLCEGFSSSTDLPVPPEPPSPPVTSTASKRRLGESDLPKKKKSKQNPKQEPITKSVVTPRRQQKAPAKKPTPKSAPAKRSAPVPKKSSATSPASGRDDTMPGVGAAVELSAVTSPPRMNAHKLKILIGKQALAAIKEGTRESTRVTGSNVRSLRFELSLVTSC